MHVIDDSPPRQRYGPYLEKRCYVNGVSGHAVKEWFVAAGEAARFNPGRGKFVNLLAEARVRSIRAVTGASVAAGRAACQMGSRLVLCPQH